MKIKFIFILMFILLLVFGCFNSKNYIKINKIKEYNIIKYNLNIFLINKNMNIQYIKKIIPTYSILINNFINGNDFSQNKIENSDFIFIFIDKEWKEVLNIDNKVLEYLNKNRKFKKEIDMNKLYYSINQRDYNAIALYSSNMSLAVFRLSQMQDTNSIIFTILAEYNHYLIENNLKNHFGIEYEKFIKDYEYYYLDDSITYFYSLYMDFLKKEYDFNIISSEIYKLNEHDLNKYIYYIYHRYSKSYIKPRFIPFKDIFLGLPLLEGRSVYFYEALLIPMIYKNYGFKYVTKLIKFLYTSRYLSLDEIIFLVFNESLDAFIKKWEEEVITLIFKKMTYKSQIKITN